MTLTMTFGWWAVPAAVTTMALLWAFFWPQEDQSWWAGIMIFIRLVPALLVSLLAWAIAGWLK